jgi:hypothetical protein
MIKAASRAFATFLLMAAAAIGEEEKPSAQEGWQRLFREQAAAYQIECGDSGRAELIREPVLQWSLPARGGQHGAIFLWVKDGLPIAIGTLNIWPLDNGAQRVAHELHSLSQTPLSAVWQTRKWTPPKDSVQWRRLDVKIAAPAGRDQRLRRMRGLAGEFTARSRDYNNRQSVLRLLPRPLYRYDLEAAEAERPREVLDGAIFGFVEGTDLEVVFLVELRPAAEGDQWWYAAARMSDYSLDLMHGDRTVWQVGSGEYDRSKASYFCADVEIRQSPDQK